MTPTQHPGLHPRRLAYTTALALLSAAIPGCSVIAYSTQQVVARVTQKDSRQPVTGAIVTNALPEEGRFPAYRDRRSDQSGQVTLDFDAQYSPRFLGYLFNDDGKPDLTGKKILLRIQHEGTTETISSALKAEKVAEGDHFAATIISISKPRNRKSE